MNIKPREYNNKIYGHIQLTPSVILYIITKAPNRNSSNVYQLIKQINKMWYSVQWDMCGCSKKWSSYTRIVSNERNELQ